VAGLTSLVFPVYNPGPSLEATLAQVGPFLRRPDGQRWEVLFVCDGCTDGSAERLADWQRPFAGRVRVLAYAPNRGKGYAVRHGLAAAGGQWRVFTDVDLAYSLDDVARLADALRAGPEVVIASRSHPESRLELPTSMWRYVARRRFQSRLFGLVVRGLLPLNLSDTQAGLKGFSARAAAMLLPRLSCDGFGFDCEILTACVRYGLPIAELPVCVRYDAGAASTTGARSGLRMVRELWLIRREWRRPAPPADAPAEPTYRKAV
jgi:dolichyl-phosphate beta-glucosyltransferase